jgi:hypothetical protein
MRRFFNAAPALLATSVALTATAPALAQDDSEDTGTPTEEELGHAKEALPPQEEPPQEEPSPAEVPPEDEDAEKKHTDLVEQRDRAQNADLARARRKVRLGLRGGYGAPLGNIQKGSSLSTDSSDPVPYGVAGLIPIWLDLGYMAFPKIMIGLYAHYGIAFFTDCSNCSGRDIRFGLQLQYHFAPISTFDAWLGAGVGYEFLSTKEQDSAAGEDGTFAARGFEFVNVQAGLDIELAEALTVGPVVSFSLGQFSDQTTKAPGQPEQSGSIEDAALHMWLEPGLKVTLRL